MANFLDELNRLGEDGWEAVGITPRTHYDWAPGRVGQLHLRGAAGGFGRPPSTDEELNR